MQRLVLAIPCFNEAERLDAEKVARLLEDPRVSIVFSNDGSTDGTAERLVTIAAAHPGRIDIHTLPENRGKAEAVRTAMQHALAQGADVVGYLDADFATPPEELPRLLDELLRSNAALALGSRVVRLGADLDRPAARRYLGRIFSTAASAVLDLSIYDSQCGAKLFRDTKALRVALVHPFASRWAFDVELLGRLTTGTAQSPPLGREDLLEVPLRRWHEVGGSKLGAAGMARAGLDLFALARRVRRLGRRGFFPD